MANPQQHPNCYRTRQQLSVGEQRYQYHSLPALAQAGFTNVGRLPFSIRILLENLLRHEDGVAVKKTDIAAVANWDAAALPDKEIYIMPARVLLQDFTGVPAVADLAAMRAALKNLGGDAKRITPFVPAELVIDHSVQVDQYGADTAFRTGGRGGGGRGRGRGGGRRGGRGAGKDF